MTFQPALPATGYAGWQFLRRSRDSQQAAFDQGARIRRETREFAERIGKVTTAAQLVSDRRLLAVALGAFGLDADINARAFVQKVLEGGTRDSSGLAQRLADKRYLQFAAAFGFGDQEVRGTTLPGFVDRITAAYRERQFEIALGEQDGNLRLALGFSRDLDAILAQQKTPDGRWFGVMGNAPVMQVIRAGLGLQASFSALSIDRQLVELRDAAQRTFGSSEVDQFARPEAQERLIRLFLIRSAADGTAPSGPGRTALALLRASA